MEDFLARKEKNLLEDVYGIWREKRLRDTEKRVVEMRRNREASEHLERWKERSIVSCSSDAVLTIPLSRLHLIVSSSTPHAQGAATTSAARAVEELHDPSGAHRSGQGLGLRGRCW